MIKEVVEGALTTILQEIEGSREPGVLRDGIVETPSRVAKMYTEIFDGYDQDPAKYLEKQFDVDHNDVYDHGIVLVKDIEFYSNCEHHMVPFFGTCHIAYIPRKRVVGLSKFARVVNAYAHRLQVQERLTEQVANLIQDVLDPIGVMVVVKAKHMCMCSRGVKNPTAETVTSVLRGKFAVDAAARAEVLSLLTK